jgi:hypothetical protein
MIKLKLLNKIEAQQYISEPDLYMDSVTPYYISKILHQKGTMEDFVVNFQNSCFDFKDSSVKTLKEYEDRLNNDLSKLGLDIDETVYFISTNGRDNINLPYTKGKAVIVPNYKCFGINITGSDLLGYPLTVHEIFHTLSRNNQDLRKSCYKSLGWIDAGKPLFNDDLLNEIFINPDAVSHDHYINYHINGETVKLAPLMYKEMGRNSFAVIDDSLEVKKIEPFFNYNQYGSMWRNTSYNNHPEELSAEHFRVLICHGKASDMNMLNQFHGALKEHFAIS